VNSFEPITKAMNNWYGEVFAYFDHPVTNAYTESLNSLIRVMNRLGRGYSFEALRARILFTEGMQKKKRVTSSYRAKKKAAERIDVWGHSASAIGDMMDDRASQRQRVKKVSQVKNYGADISTLVRMIEEGQL
jgi:ERCC4-related helicase